MNPSLHVMPLDVDGGLTRVDSAGYVVATSQRPREWPDAPDRYQFSLDVAAATVSGSSYQPHRRL